MLIIDNPGKHFSKVFEQGDIAVVTMLPHISNNLVNWLEAQGALGRVSGIFPIMTHFPKDNKMPTAELRIGWARVLREIELLTDTKRILLMCNTKMLYIVAPVLRNMHGGDMDDVHGSLFGFGKYILVPTEEFSELKHTEQWRNRDLARCLKLSKPAEPLNYHEHLPRKVTGDLVIDLETTGLDPLTDTITTIGVQWSDTGRALLKDKRAFIAWLLDQDLDNLIMHNAQFDLGFLGVDVRKKFYGKIRDTMILAKARGELVASLKHLGNAYTARPGNYSWLDLLDGQHNFDDPAYVCEDVDVTYRLWKLWQSECSRPVVEIMDRAIVMACEQSLAGSFLDASRLDTLAIDGAAHVVHLRAELEAKYGCDPGQTDVLTSKLREMGYPLSKQTKTGKDALTAEVLEEHGLIDILEFRRAMKLDSAFVGKLKVLLRPNCTLPHRQTILGAKTGRTTMTEFNWQQMPKKGPGKTLLVSRYKGGKIGNVDLKQAEVRVACWYAVDQVLAKALVSGDMHRENAARGFKKPAEAVTDDERFQAKALIFRSIFGGGPTNDQQKRVHEYMVKEFSKLFAWIDRQKKIGQTQYQVTDLLGKVTNMLDKFDYAGKWACGRLGINAPVQGTSSHVAIWLTVRCWELFREMSLKSLVLFGVHDSITFDIHPEEENMVIAAVQQAFRDLNGSVFAVLFPMMTTLPMEGELQLGNSWADCKNGVVHLCSSLIPEGELPF